jgi:hypothetical protein
MLEEFYMWTVSDNFLTFRFLRKVKVVVCLGGLVCESLP